MNWITKIWNFYYLGFKNQSRWGRQVWLIILIKLFIMFFVLKLFFFPNFLNSRFETDKDRGDYVIEQLTKTKNQKDK